MAKRKVKSLRMDVEESFRGADWVHKVEKEPTIDRLRTDLKNPPPKEPVLLTEQDQQEQAKTSDRKIEEARRLRGEQVPVKEIAERLGIAVTTVRRWAPAKNQTYEWRLHRRMRDMASRGRSVEDIARLFEVEVSVVRDAIGNP